ncbi:MAG: DUF4349 domain-containing protein [Faecousia sp.]
MKKLTALFVALLLVLAIFTACGNSAASGSYKVEAPAAAASMDMRAEMAMDTNGVLAEESGSVESSALPENRKWVVTVRMDAETEDLDTLLAELDKKITAMNGYVEDQEIYNGSTYSSRRHRNANLTIRIPAGDVSAFTEEVAGIANVVSSNLSREDITLTYVATESRITALKTEEGRLLELLAQADNMSDLLEIEARLSDLRYELESYSSRMRLYDNQVDYATLYLYISEVQEYTPVVEQTIWERIRDGFVSSVKGLTDGIVDFVVWVLANSPYLVVWGLILTGLVILLRKLRIRRRVKKSPLPKKDEQA